MKKGVCMAAINSSEHMKKVFVSYCHKDGDWVWNDLVPCLRAGGSDVLIDRERFGAGQELLIQMDATYDESDLVVLILSPHYLNSTHCVHEMNRAVEGLNEHTQKIVIPIKRGECPIPERLQHLRYVDLSHSDKTEWDVLLSACCCDLGANAKDWLDARDAVVKFLRRNESVNLVVQGNPRWYELIRHVKANYCEDLGIVDLDRGVTASRAGLVAEILRSCGVVSEIPSEPRDLVELDRVLSFQRNSKLALLHTDHISHRRQYGVDLFSTLRYLIMDSRKLTLLAQSRRPFAELLPRDHPLSIIQIQTVLLRGS